MASADFWRRIPTPLDVGSTRHLARSPRVMRIHLHAYVRRIYVVALRASIGLCRYWPAHPATPPLSDFCSSDQRFACGFLQIRSRPRHPCRSASTSPCRVCRGLPPPSERALPGATKESPNFFAVGAEAVSFRRREKIQRGDPQPFMPLGAAVSPWTESANDSVLSLLPAVRVATIRSSNSIDGVFTFGLARPPCLTRKSCARVQRRATGHGDRCGE